MCRIAPLLLAFVLLGFAYSVATPIFETPDELQHYAHVNYVAHYWWFPPLGAKPAEHLWDQQALQAPLFYWVAAAATSWVDTSDFSKQAVLQPKANIGDATLPGKKNAFLHGPDQSFPYRGTTLAVHICRWVSVLFGAGTVLLTFSISCLTFAPAPRLSSVGHRPAGEEASPPQFGAVTNGGGQGWGSLLPTALVAFIPQFIFINASCSNDPAITFTSTLTLFLLVRIARDGVTGRRAVVLGVAIGLMALSKLIGTVLAAIAFVLLLIVTRRLSAIFIAGAVFSAVAGGWYVYNQIVYGDPLALGAFLRFVGGNLGVPPLSISFLWDQFRLLRFSTWGLFGHISVLMQPEWIYLIYDIGAAVGLTSFLLASCLVFFRAVREYGPVAGSTRFASDNRVVLIVIVWFAVVLALGVRWFLAAGIQGRLIFPGLPAGAVLWAYGLNSVRHRFTGLTSVRSLALIVSLPMAAFAAAVIPAYLLPAYSPPPLVKSVPPNARPAEIVFGDEIALRGYTIARDRDLLRLTFYWDTLKTPAVDYTVAIRLVRPDGSFWLDYVNYPGMGTSLPTTWKPGEMRRDEYVFDVDRFPAESQALRLIVGYYDRRARDMIPVSHWHDVRERGWATLQEVDINHITTR